MSEIGRRLGVSKTTVNRRIKEWKLKERSIDKQRKIKWHNYRTQSFVLKNNKELFISGREYPIDYKYTDKQTVTARAKKIRGDKCEICGWNKATVDGHHRLSIALGGHHELNNIKLLCPNCHRLVHKKIIEI